MVTCDAYGITISRFRRVDWRHRCGRRCKLGSAKVSNNFESGATELLECLAPPVSDPKLKARQNSISVRFQHSNEWQVGRVIVGKAEWFRRELQVDKRSQFTWLDFEFKLFFTFRSTTILLAPKWREINLFSDDMTSPIRSATPINPSMARWEIRPEFQCSARPSIALFDLLEQSLQHKTKDERVTTDPLWMESWNSCPFSQINSAELLNFL